MNYLTNDLFVNVLSIKLVFIHTKCILRFEFKILFFHNNLLNMFINLIFSTIPK